MSIHYNPATGSYEPDSPDGFDWVTYAHAVALFQGLATSAAMRAERHRGRGRAALGRRAEAADVEARLMRCEFLADAFAVGLCGCVKERVEA